MEQDEHVAGATEQGGQAPAPAPAPAAGPSVKVAGAEEGSIEPERVSEMDNLVHGAELVSFKKKDLEEPLTESGGAAAVDDGGGRGAALGSVHNEDREVFENPIAAHFEFRATAANATPPSTSRRLPSRSRKPAGPTKFVAEGAAELAGSEIPVLGASSSAPAPAPHEDVSAMAGGDQGAASGDHKKQKQDFFVPGALVAIAHASPPDSYRLQPSRSRKQSSPERFIVAGAAASAGAPAASDPPPPAGLDSTLPSASASAPVSVTGTYEDVSAMVDGDQGAVPGDDKKQREDCFVPGAMVAIAHASPPDSYRLQPSRSRKQSSPTRFIAAGAPAPAAAPAAGDPPPPAGLGSTLPSASASASGLRMATRSASDATAPKASSGVNDASSSSSDRLPSRGRKQPRPEHFIPEEAEATASGKARRSDIVLDRFLSSLVHGSSEPRPEWVRNVTADDVRGQQRQRSIEGFRIRDASHHAARVRELRAAISRLGATGGDPSSSARPGCASPSAAAASGSPPGEPDGSWTIYGVLAVLGASLALSVVSCVLFYIVGKRSESGPSGEQEKE